MFTGNGADNVESPVVTRCNKLWPTCLFYIFPQPMSQVCSYNRHKSLKPRVDHNRFNKPLQSPGPNDTPFHSPTFFSQTFLGGWLWDSVFQSPWWWWLWWSWMGLNPGLSIPPPHRSCRMLSPLAGLPAGRLRLSLLGYAPQHVLDCVGERREAYNHKQVG